MITLLFYVSLALGVSFLCSLLEATLLSMTPTYMANLEARRPKVYALWKAFKSDIDKPLAAILSLNTIAHTVGAAGAGAQAVKLFGDVYFGVISAVLTLLILVFSEIIPKTLGARYWAQLAPFCAYALQWVQWSMYPLVAASKMITRLLSPTMDGPSLSRDDITVLTALGRREGIIDENEARAIDAMLAFRGLIVRDVMTPRTVMSTLPASDSVEQVLSEYPELRFSRIPIYDKPSDDLIGFVRKDEIYRQIALGRPATTLFELKRDLLCVLESKPLPDMLERLVAARITMALVINEYGDPLGLVTMEDLVETMIGMEIVDESDSHIDMQERARELWRRRANIASGTDNAAEL